MATIASPLPPAPAADRTLPEIELDQRSASKSVYASQWKLMYWRFMRHRLAVVATVVVVIFYILAIFCEFISPMDPNKVSNTYRYVPPQPITFFDHSGHFTLRPGVYGLKGVRNPETLRITYTVDKTQWTPIHFFVKGDPYKFWGLWKTNVHLVGIGVTQGVTGGPVITTGVAPAPATGAGVTTGTSGNAGVGAGAVGGQTGIGSIAGLGGSSSTAVATATPRVGGPAPGSGNVGAPSTTGFGSISGLGSAGSSSGPTTAAPTVGPLATATRIGSATSSTTAATAGTAAGTTSAAAGTTVSSASQAPAVEVPFFLMGTDRLGRDMLSRMIYGARISLSIGLLGVALSFVLGVILGGMSGYYGGMPDLVIQRIVEFIRSVPTLPLLMGLAAAMPPKWPPTKVYFCITLILAVFGWTGLARVVRGRFLALREEDFILAARFTNCSEARIIGRHMVPAFMSHLIASATLLLPGMILSETSLSFLGLGLRPPVISWGVLLQEAQNIQTVALFPWLLLPLAPILLISLSFNFMGDGLRDAADPYAR